MTAAGETHVRRWTARPWRARAVRLLVYSLPIAASLAFVQLVTALTGVPTSSLWIFLAWWLGISALATLVVSVGYALTRRLLPLGALLGLSLVFPDEAPSRFRLALGAGTVESLEKRLQRAGERHRPPPSTHPLKGSRPPRFSGRFTAPMLGGPSQTVEAFASRKRRSAAGSDPTSPT